MAVKYQKVRISMTCPLTGKREEFEVPGYLITAPTAPELEAELRVVADTLVEELDSIALPEPPVKH